MRTKKPTGFWKIHQNCGICQKPKNSKAISITKEQLKEMVKALEECRCEENSDDT